MTKFGEVGFYLDNMANLMTVFSQYGMILIYSQEGDLQLASFDVGDHLMSWDYNDVMAQKNHGRNIIELVRYLESRRLNLYFAVDLKMRRFQLTVVNDKGQSQVIKKLENLDFTRRFTGDLGVGSRSNDEGVAFEVALHNGEDIMVSFGERKGRLATLRTIEASTYVEFEDELLGDEPDRLQKLVSKMVLND